MRKHAFHLLSFLSLALLVALCTPQRAAADEDDPPSRVARLGYVSGSVSFQPAGTDDWVSAVVNRPMTTGDKLWADNDSRAEMHIGSASIRIGSTTGFSFLNLTDDVTQLRITEGTLRIRVKRLDENENFEIDTPNLAFSILRTGIYKINVNEAGDTTVVKVFRGEGEVTGGGSAYTVHSGEVGIFNGLDELNADVEGINNDEDDDFDAWAAERDHREDVSVSARYVSTDAIGYEDLDEYGGWRPVPEYGTIWFPHTAVVGWAPYHYGHWAYIAPWGYTWVDDAPWGFAPFHYGRWVTVGGVWGWVPCAPRPVEVVGVAYVRPVYAPALVAWVGGPHFGVGVGVGVSVGWFPLGPREVYVPSYHVSRNYVNNVNISNTTVNTTVVNNYYNTTVVNKTVNVTNVTYVNQRVPGAVTATTSQAFTSAQPVAKNAVVVNQREVATAAVNVTTPAVAPSRQAVLGSGESARVRPPAALQARAVVAKTAPPAPPVAFARQQQAIQANGGRPLAISQVRQIAPPAAAQTAQSNVKIAPPAKPATPQNIQANRPGQPVNNANKPGAPNYANQPANNGNRPSAPNNPPQQVNNGNRPGTPNNPPQPANTGNRPANAPGNTPVNANQKALTDRPPSSRPAPPAVDPQLEQKHQQQVEQLRQQQDQERQKVEQQQQQERQKLEQQKADQERQQQQQLQKQQQQQQQQQQQERLKQQQKADEARQQQQQQQQQQQLEQKHNQQLQELEQKHAQEEQRLKQQQQQEKQQRQQPPPQQSKPAKQDKPKDEKDKPHSK
jgi:hypothetical protein